VWKEVEDRKANEARIEKARRKREKEKEEKTSNRERLDRVEGNR